MGLPAWTSGPTQTPAEAPGRGVKTHSTYNGESNGSNPEGRRDVSSIVLRAVPARGLVLGRCSLDRYSGTVCLRWATLTSMGVSVSSDELQLLGEDGFLTRLTGCLHLGRSAVSVGFGSATSVCSFDCLSSATGESSLWDVSTAMRPFTLAVVMSRVLALCPSESNCLVVVPVLTSR